MNPNNQVYYSSTGNPNKNKRLLVIIGLIIVVIAAVAYMIVSGMSGNGNDTNPQGGGKETEGGRLPLSSLQDFDFIAPDMKGFVKRSNLTIDVGDYTTTDNACNIQFGVVPAVELPGLTPQEIAASHLGATASAGATNAEPKKGKNLELKASKGAARYVMPSLSYEYMRDNVNYKAAYHLVILSENRRAFIRSYCANDEGPVSSQSFNKISDKIKQIKIRVEE